MQGLGYSLRAKLKHGCSALESTHTADKVSGTPLKKKSETRMLTFEKSTKLKSKKSTTEARQAINIKQPVHNGVQGATYSQAMRFLAVWEGSA